MIVVRQDDHPLDLFINGKSADASVHSLCCGWRQRSSILSALLLLSTALATSRSTFDHFLLDTPGIDNGVASSSNEKSSIFSSPNHASDGADVISSLYNGNIRSLGSQIVKTNRTVLSANGKDEMRSVGLPRQTRHGRCSASSTGGRAKGVSGISTSKVPHLDGTVDGSSRKEDATAVEFDVSHRKIVARPANRPADLGGSLPQLSSVGRSRTGQIVLAKDGIATANDEIGIVGSQSVGRESISVHSSVIVIVFGHGSLVVVGDGSNSSMGGRASSPKRPSTYASSSIDQG